MLSIKLLSEPAEKSAAERTGPKPHILCSRWHATLTALVSFCVWIDLKILPHMYQPQTQAMYISGPICCACHRLRSLKTNWMMERRAHLRNRSIHGGSCIIAAAQSPKASSDSKRVRLTRPVKDSAHVGCQVHKQSVQGRHSDGKPHFKHFNFAQLASASLS